MYKIVITGGIASGKTLFCSYLSDLGFDILDADDVVHSLEAPGGAAVQPIADAFGECVIKKDGSVDRVKLGKLVFNDAAVRAKLNSIVHPLVEKSMKKWLEQPHEGIPAVVIPLLFELGWEEQYDCVVTLVSDKKLQIQRLIEMRGCTEAEAEARFASQLPVPYKADHSHIVANNNGSADALRSEAERVHSLLKKRYA